MNTNVLTGVGALFHSTKTGRYLFLLRQGSSYSNNWGLVGGKLEAGETLMQGFTREIAEEVGPTPSFKLIPVEQFTSDNERFVYHTFLAIVEDEFVPDLNHEHKGYCWVGLDDYPKPLHPGVWKTFNFEDVMDKIRIAADLNRS